MCPWDKNTCITSCFLAELQTACIIQYTAFTVRPPLSRHCTGENQQLRTRVGRRRVVVIVAAVVLSRSWRSRYWLGSILHAKSSQLVRCCAIEWVRRCWAMRRTWCWVILYVKCFHKFKNKINHTFSSHKYSLYPHLRIVRAEYGVDKSYTMYNKNIYEQNKVRSGKHCCCRIGWICIND